AAVSIDGSVLAFDAGTGAVTTTFNADAREKLYYLAFSPDGRRIAAAGEPGIVWIWDWATGQPLRIDRHPDQVRCSGVTFGPAGRCLGSMSNDQSTVSFLDALTGQSILTLEGHTGAVTGIMLEPDGTRIASASTDMTVRIWNARNGEELLALQGHTQPLRTL